MNTQVTHNVPGHQYEIRLDGRLIGHANYSERGNDWHFDHTEVIPSEQGKNYAAILMREALADVRAAGIRKVVPTCSYVYRYMQLHPETQDLLAVPLDQVAAYCKLPQPEAKPKP